MNGLKLKGRIGHIKKELKLLLYCTKEKNKYDRLVSDEHYGKPFYLYGAITENFESLNGKIVAECDFEVEEIKPHYWESCINYWFKEELLKKSCLNMWQMRDYLNGKNGYAIHIKNLKVFDEPKELKEYKRKDEFMGGKQVFWETIKKAPQNMMYAYDNDNEYILISIQPQWMCLILNRIKDVEIRRVVLKEMVGLI